jgi:hypothetical protein
MKQEISYLEKYSIYLEKFHRKLESYWIKTVNSLMN